MIGQGKGRKKIRKRRKLKWLEHWDKTSKSGALSNDEGSLSDDQFKFFGVEF